MSYDPSPGPQGQGQNSAVVRPIYVSNSLIKLCFISASGLRGDSIIDKIYFFDTQAPQSLPTPLEHDQGVRIKISSDMFLDEFLEFHW